MTIRSIQPRLFSRNFIQLGSRKTLTRFIVLSDSMYVRQVNGGPTGWVWSSKEFLSLPMATFFFGGEKGEIRHAP